MYIRRNYIESAISQNRENIQPNYEVKGNIQPEYNYQNKEVIVVFFAYTVVKPITVVIKGINASIALATMFCFILNVSLTKSACIL